MRRTVFPHKLLPWLLVAPQLAITLIFFYWPAGQAFRQSMLKEDPFGLTSTFVGLANFRKVLSDPNYLNSLRVTVVFSALVAFLAMAIALFLAVQAEKIVRGKGIYRTMMIWRWRRPSQACCGCSCSTPASARWRGPCAPWGSTGTRC
jgi:sn-glycerol 3-phosphate transport system permease protein